jgi:hypothetical protein
LTAGGIIVIELVEKRPLDRHDSLTKDVWHRLEGDIRRVAAGAEPSEAWRDERGPIAMASMDEFAVEGFHRTAIHEDTRTTKCKMLHLKGPTRQTPD